MMYLKMVCVMLVWPNLCVSRRMLCLAYRVVAFETGFVDMC